MESFLENIHLLLINVIKLQRLSNMIQLFMLLVDRNLWI